MNLAAPELAPDTVPYTPVEYALELLRERQQNKTLRQTVCDVLSKDIPTYLLEHDCFVLSRHIATPNNEALYVLESAKRLGATAIFSQDLEDLFLTVNDMKRRLAKPEICFHRSGKRCYRKIDLVDIPSAERLPLGNVLTLSGQNLSQIHNNIFDHLQDHNFRVVSDSDWIDRNCRGKMSEHYYRFLLLYCAYGVLFEDFGTNDDFVFYSNVVYPVMKRINNLTGCVPIIVKSSRPGIETSDKFHLAHSEKLERYFFEV